MVIEQNRLRGIGRALSFHERRIAIVERDIAELEAKRQRDKDRFQASDPAYEQSLSRWDAKIAEKKASLERRREQYRQLRSQMEGVELNAARAAAPKQYRTDRINQGNYLPGDEPNRVALNAQKTESRQYGNVRVQVVESRFAQRRNDQAQLREAQRRPGIYRLSDGTAVVSSRGDGAYAAERQFANKPYSRPGRDVVEVRSANLASSSDNRPSYPGQVGTTKTGRPIYQEQRPAALSGFDLFNPDTRTALKENAGNYKTTGEMYAAASATPANPPVEQRREIKRKPTALSPYVGKIGTEVYRYGQTGREFFDQRIQSGKKAPIERVARYGFGRVEGLGQYVAAKPDEALGTGVAYAYGGQVAGSALGITTSAVARTSTVSIGRVGVPLGIRGAQTLQTGAAVTGAAGLAYETYTKSPQEAGAGDIKLFAGGAGFAQGYKNVAPSRVTFGRVRSSAEARTGSGGTSIIAGGESRAQVVEFGNVRTETVPVSFTFAPEGRMVGGDQLGSVRAGYAVNYMGRNRVFTEEGVGVLRMSGRTSRLSVSMPNRQRPYVFLSRGRLRRGVPNAAGERLEVNSAVSGGFEQRGKYWYATEGSREDYWTNTFGQRVVKGGVGRGRQIGVRSGDDFDVYQARGFSASSVRPEVVSEGSAGALRGSWRGGLPKQDADAGFNMLSNSGRWRGPVTENPRTLGPLVGRKGSASVGRSVVTEPVSPRYGGQRSSGVVGRSSFSGYEFPSVTGGSRAVVMFPSTTSARRSSFAQSSSFGLGYARGPSSRSSAALRLGAVPGTRTGVGMGTAALFGTSTVRSPAYRTASIPVTRTGLVPGISTPVNPRDPATPPGAFPFMFAVPPGRGGPDWGGGRRGFQYAPSLSASMFNITATKAPRVSGGFDVRPIVVGKRRRRK